MGDNRPNISELALPKLNAIRVIIVMMIAIGYASTMPFGQNKADGSLNQEIFFHLGYDPSWIGISLLFFLSGFLGMRSLDRHGSSLKYLESRLLRTGPLLIFVTLIIILILYPIFGEPSTSPGETLKIIFLYFLGTVSCIKPGEQLPGILDHAQYECMIQGAIWTLKWGVIAHIAMAAGNALNLFENRLFVLFISLMTTIFYMVIVYLNITFDSVPHDIILAARMAWPFLVGVSIYKYWDKLPKSAVVNLAISAGFIALATFQFYVEGVPWTKAIIVSLTMGWAWLCVTLLKLDKEQLTILNNWAPLALALYLVNWPAAQIILLITGELPLTVFIPLILMVSVILAWVFHKLVSERSFQFARRRNGGVVQA